MSQQDQKNGKLAKGSVKGTGHSMKGRKKDISEEVALKFMLFGTLGDK